MDPIKIQIRNGTIKCDPNDGHVRAKHSTKLEWVSPDEQFTLSFALLFGSGDAWPFKETQPPVFKPTNSFRGTLKHVGPKEDAPAYKYTVKIAGKALDPIIIVDK
jgi:hypothetical protein